MVDAADAVGSAVDWPQILQLCTVLLTMEPTPVVRVNLAVALAEAGNLAAAQAMLDTRSEALVDFQPCHAAQAEVYAKAGDKDSAHSTYSVAIALASNDSDLLFLEGQNQQLGLSLHCKPLPK